MRREPHSVTRVDNPVSTGNPVEPDEPRIPGLPEEVRLRFAHPAAVLRDPDEDRLERFAIKGLDDETRRQDGNLVLRGPPAEEDGDTLSSVDSAHSADSLDSAKVLLNLEERDVAHHVTVREGDIHEDAAVLRVLAAHVHLGTLGDDGLIERHISDCLKGVPDTNLTAGLRLCNGRHNVDELSPTNRHLGSEQSRHSGEEQDDSHGFGKLREQAAHVTPEK